MIFTATKKVIDKTTQDRIRIEFSQQQKKKKRKFQRGNKRINKKSYIILNKENNLPNLLFFPNSTRKKVRIARTKHFLD